MRWQRAAQFAIAGFVVVFIGVIATSMRSQKAQPHEAAPPPRQPGNPQIENPRGGDFTRYQGDRKVFDVKFGKNLVFPDGRTTFSDGVELTTNRDGRDMVVKAEEADIVPDGSKGIKTAVFRRQVSLTSGGGMVVKAGEATYDEAEGIVKIPGPVEFVKGRTSGQGVGATYDRTRDVLWILDKAQVTVAPGPDGKGAVSATSKTAGLARAEHYMRLTSSARITATGRIIEGDEITITLTEDDQRIQTLQLRGNSRISGGASGPQTMTARDIDLMYGDDGRTLQHATLIEHAVLQLAGPAGSGGKRIAGNAIDFALGPDGTTITNLTATENVQVDLPAETDVPAKRIRSSTLVAAGAPDRGLQQATFAGKVEFRETQAARRNAAAIDRTARSETLIVDTKPGLGAIQKADFRGNVKFIEAPDLIAEAQRGLYYLDRNRIELMPSDGDPGPSPLLNDGKISVSARTINFTLGTRALEADTKVRSTILTGQRAGRGQPPAPGQPSSASKVPSMLKADEPVNVTSNRLDYAGALSTATYSGNVKLWQGTETTIKGDTIVLDDKNGNLTATANVSTLMTLDELDQTTGRKKRTETTGKSESFVYNEAQRLATYTTRAQIQGPQGHVTAEKIELFLKPVGSNELDRAEAYGSSADLVTVREGLRTGRGTHLTYTAADERYLMVGTPVTMIEDQKDGTCNVGTGSTLQFFRASEKGQMDGNGISRGNTENGPCPGLKR
ncbi:MAG: LptA/OstA family protein [Vicinamibacterales bacterium]